MGTQYLNTQVRLKRGTAEAWSRNNPVLEKGEPGWAIDSKVLKIGDGETHWNDLTYVVNVSDYVTEEELRAAIEKYDGQIREWLEELAVDVDAAFEDIYQTMGEFATDVEQRFAEIDDTIEEAVNTGRAYTDAKTKELDNTINTIGNTVQSHDTQLKQSV